LVLLEELFDAVSDIVLGLLVFGNKLMQSIEYMILFK